MRRDNLKLLKEDMDRGTLSSISTHEHSNIHHGKQLLALPNRYHCQHLYLTHGKPTVKGRKLGPVINRGEDLPGSRHKYQHNRQPTKAGGNNANNFSQGQRDNNIRPTV